MTSAENKLWYHLRGRRLAGLKFVRQAPIGPYFVDFVCRDLKLIVEIDGATHGETNEIAYDEKRSALLRNLGYRVFRVWNGDVYENLDGVLNALIAVADEMRA
jgi:very-short-patch-repair endonuclease